MMDLIGFWSGVTLLTWVLLCSPLSGLFIMTEVAVNWASRERVDVSRKMGKIYNTIYPGWDGFIASIWCISAGCWLIYLIALGVSANEGVDIRPVYIIVSEFAQSMTPVMSVIGTLAVVFGGGALLMRKVFDVFFSIQDKLEKLK